MNVDELVLSRSRPPTRVQPVVVLAVAEGRRMVRHPLLLGAAAVACLLFGVPWLHGEPAQEWSTQNYGLLGLVGLPMYLAAFVLGNGAALRERPSTTAEMFLGLPTSYAQRTQAILLAGVVPTAASAIVVAAYQAVVVHGGGITVGDQVVTIRLTPTVLELALVPAITATSFTAGIALARALPSRVMGVMLAGVLTEMLTGTYWLWSWFPAYFLAPYASGLRRTRDLGMDPSTLPSPATMLVSSDQPDSTWWVLVREPDRVGWHVVYLIGITAVLAGYAVRRSGRHSPVRTLLTCGALLILAGLLGQLVVHGGPFPWGGDVGAQE